MTGNTPSCVEVITSQYAKVLRCVRKYLSCLRVVYSMFINPPPCLEVSGGTPLCVEVLLHVCRYLFMSIKYLEVLHVSCKHSIVCGNTVVCEGALQRVEVLCGV